MHSFKKLLIATTATLAFLTIPVLTALPFTTPTAHAASYGSPDVFVDGEELHFDVPPQIHQRRTLVPMRMIFESLGADVSWEPQTRTAVAFKDGVTIRLPIGSPTVTRNNEPITLDVPAQLIDSRTMVPIRFVSEAFGDKVIWDDTSYQVRITTAHAPIIRVIGADRALEEGQTESLQHQLLDHHVAEQLEQAAGLTFQQPVWIYLSNSDAGYEASIRTYGEDNDQAKLVADGSTGVTYDSDVLLPLQRQTDESELLTTVSHELTHVLLNQNNGTDLPSWVHEGFAWQAGLDIGYQEQPALQRQQVDGLVREEVLDAVDAGDFRPLINSAFTKIAALSSASYNLELQDYLAYQYLVDQYGQDAFRAYLLGHANGDETPFQDAFGLTPKAFNEQFTNHLQQQLLTDSQGVEVTLQVDDTFRDGQMRILPEGQSNWKSLRLQPGTYTFRIFKNGRVEGLPTYDGFVEEEPEADTVYLYLEPKDPLEEAGTLAYGGGFAIADTYGSYWLTNAWLYDEQDNATYPDTDNLFGVQIVSIKPIPLSN
ncbi:MAG TPA: stalk domain-containing protein [Bacilli bacterium]|nr:stalk domain-containing protein [Bacilli bacterium]